MTDRLKNLVEKIVFKSAALPGLALFTAVFLFGSGQLAFASGDGFDGSLGGLICDNMMPNSGAFAELFSIIAYAAAAVFVVLGVHHFRLHSDQPSQNPLHKPIMLWAGSAGLFALPQIVNTLVSSIYGSATPGGGLACSDTPPTDGGPGLDSMLIAFVANTREPLLYFTSGIAYLCGIYMVIRGLMKASKYGYDPKTHSIHSILTHMVFGALLISISNNLDVIMSSVFGDGSTGVTALDAGNVLSWDSSVSNVLTAQFKASVNAALNFVQIIGAIAFVRGWLIMKKVVEGGGNVTPAQGITHIIGGVLAINIFTFLGIMDYTFGTNLLS